MVLSNIKHRAEDHGFTIVELLVVIVVIGILAAITIVSYTGITARANTSSAQSSASAVNAKAGVFNADGPTGNFPTTFTQLSQAASTATYYLSGVSFTSASNDTSSATMTAALNTSWSITSPATVDYSLCGTGPAGAAPVNFAGITIPTGIKVGYFDYTTQTASTTPLTSGTISGGNVTCYKVGSPEALIATARAYYGDNASAWPTKAQIDTYTALSTTSAKVPTGLTINTVTTAPTAGAQVWYNCKTGGCAANGGRVGFWDYTAAAAKYIYFGGAIVTDTWIAG